MSLIRPVARPVAGILIALLAGAARAAPPAAADDSGTTEILVTARKLDAARNSLMPETGSSSYHLGTEEIKNLPLGDATPLNEVLLRAPGVTQDSFGQLHVRGDHANIQYRINDVVIPESISLFGQALNPRFASQISLLTGALPAQYGYRTAGVVDIHTKGSDYAGGGEVSVLGGTQGHREASGEVSGSSGPLSFYATSGHVANDIGIENPLPTRDALHDHTDQWNGFGYLAYLLPDRGRLSLMLGESNETFQIPTRPGELPAYAPPGVVVPPSSALDQNQHEGNRFAILAYENAVSEALHYQVAVYDRISDVHYRPDPIGDLNYSGAAGDVTRRNARWGVQADASWKAAATHTVRFGLTYNDEQNRSRNRTTVYPLDDAGAPVYAPLTIAEDAVDGSRLYGAYLQDEWHARDALTLNYGVRFDRYDGAIAESQLSPRVGLVYQPRETTTIHGGYARYFTPPPSEKITVETIAFFEHTTGAPNSTGNDPVRSERSNYYDLGILEQLTPALSIGLDGYYRDVRYLGDEGQFGSALIFAPFNYETARIAGLELTTGWRQGGTSAYLNVAYGTTRARNIVSGQYNFAPDELAAIARQSIHLDHDQRWTASTGITHTWGDTTLSGDALFGSGLRKGDLNSDHLSSYATVNVAARHAFRVGSVGGLEATLSLINLLDRVYELRDGSGVGVGAPQWGLRRTVYAGLSKTFGR
jgi:outer membrane receptor protein involved in Fe transport